MVDWVECYMNMFVSNPSHVPKYSTLHHPHSLQHPPSLEGHSKPDTTDSLVLEANEMHSPPSNSNILNVIKEPSSEDSLNNCPLSISSIIPQRLSATVSSSSNQLSDVASNLSKGDRLLSVPNNGILKSQSNCRNQKTTTSKHGIASDSLGSLYQHLETKHGSYSSMTFPNIEAEQSYVAGVVKGYERGMKLSQIALNSKHSVEEKQSKVSVGENLRSENSEPISVKSKACSTDNAGSVDINPIVKSESFKDMLEKMLMKRSSKVRERAGRHTAHTHELLMNNPKFKINLSHVMDRKHRESSMIGKKQKNSLAELDPAVRLGLLPAFHDESFRRGLEEMIRDIFREEGQLPQLSPANFSPCSSKRESIDLGQILALTGDIKDMVAYWRTHSLSSEESKKGDTVRTNEELSESKTETFEVKESLISESKEVSEQEMLSDSMYTRNSSPSVRSLTSDTADPLGSTESDMLSEPRTINTEETKHTFQYRSDILKSLEVGQVTHLATKRGNFVTYDILCLTIPGIVVEQCWLYWKVVAIVALSSVERDGRVSIGDIVFEIDGQSLRGMDKFKIRNLLASYHSGKVLRITLLKASHKPDVPKRLLTKRSIARFSSKSTFILDDEIRYSSRFKSPC